MPGYFRETPAVYAVGTHADYAALVVALKKHAVGSTAHTSFLAPNDRTMDLLLMPTCTDHTEPFMAIAERIVFQNDRLNMQLLIGGSSEAFKFLAKRFAEHGRESERPKRPTHLSDMHVPAVNQPWIATPSVNLCISNAVKKVTKRDLGRFMGNMLDRRESCVPESWRVPPHMYEKFTSVPWYNDLGLRLPRVGAPGAEQYR